MNKITHEEKLQAALKLREVAEKSCEGGEVIFVSDFVEMEEAACCIIKEVIGTELNQNQAHEFACTDIYLDEDHYPCVSSTLYISELDCIIELNATHHQKWEYSLTEVLRFGELTEKQIKSYLFELLGPTNSEELNTAKTTFLKRVFRDNRTINTFLAI